VSRVSRPDPARAELDRRVRAFIRERTADDFREDEAGFEALALELFAFQYAHCPPYARFCDARGRAPGALRSWRDVPAAPTGAFKELALRSFPPERTCKVFRTSGTTGERRGALYLDTLSLYEASLVPTFERFVLPDLAEGARARFLVLGPSPGEAADSSLAHMLGAMVARRGAPESRFFVRGGELDTGALARALAAAEESEEPVVLCGAAFAFVHALDALAARGAAFRLRASARAMETGGYKGRSRELGAEALYRAIEDRFGVSPARIVNEYGMTELASQFYDAVLREPYDVALREPAAPRRKLGPPWARVRILDPETGEDCAEGEAGLVAVVDLANTGSVIAVQTADLARRVGGGFELLGRAPGADARGCSLAADETLGAPG